MTLQRRGPLSAFQRAGKGAAQIGEGAGLTGARTGHRGENAPDEKTSEVQTLGRCQVGAAGKSLPIGEQREMASQWGSGR